MSFLSSLGLKILRAVRQSECHSLKGVDIVNIVNVYNL
jgi:hypothetical protein